MATGWDIEPKQWHPMMSLRTNTQVSVSKACRRMTDNPGFRIRSSLECFHFGFTAQTTLTHTHHQIFYWPYPWSRSEKSPFRSVPSPRTPCCFCTLSPSQQPLTPPCQGLFPKIRLNMNIHKQNGTPRLWKLSKTYLHLILKEVPTPTLPPFTESLLPPFGPLKKKKPY